MTFDDNLNSVNYNTLHQVQSKEGLLIIDWEGNIIHTNQVALHLLDLTNTTVLPNFFKSFLFFDAEYLTSIRISCQQILINAEYILSIESLGHKKKWLTVEFKQDESKNNFIVYIYDNTRLINKNILYKEQENHQKLIVSSLNEIVFEVSLDGVFLNYWTNDDALLFYPPQFFLGKKIADLFPTDITNQLETLIQLTISENKIHRMEFSSPFDNTPFKWFEAQINPILGFNNSIAILVSDITQRKDSLELLKFNEQKFNQAFHYSGVGTSLTSIEGRLIDGNATLRKILGYSAKEFETILTFKITHPEDVDYDIKIRNELIEGKRDFHTFEKRYLHKNGHYIWCSVTLSLVRNQFNKPLFFIVQLIDITELKNNQDLLQKQKIELELTQVDLESKIVQLEESNYIIAHNLRNPVCNIKMLIDNLYLELPEGETSTFLELLKHSCDDLEKTLDDLSTIVSIKYDKIESEICNFQTIIDKITSVFQLEILEKNAIIETKLEVLEVLLPKKYLESILSQLISNSLQFISENRKPIVTISTIYDQDNNLIIEINDNGIGIDLEKFKSQLFMFKKIFHRGFQNKGIGLFITKYQVEALGGKVDVISEIDKGTSFLIKFPKELVIWNNVSI